ncbi:DUF2891 domain-containing protein [Stakelama marina]|uniref:DUF2891 domain-containing protein n=1 Tax=Stakelama marina TaxID=2826939 RepID=A0A8T4IAZ7_9SPHN|nr:DUF2891 domain-containing protein [Stakelama marina]MBR0550994.1 DUF2891 domain-containing protein [Stakelama marina]
MDLLTPAIASRFATITLGHLEQQWPYKLDHVMNGPEDVVAPIDLHPVFHGSFDWHSCVHGWWQIMRLLRRFPDLPEAPDIRERADRLMVPDKVAAELDYLSRPMSAGFERPYGWAWLLALHDELTHHDAPWGETLEPLARAFAERFADHLPKLTYPIRVGTHYNSSFALTLAHGWAERHDAGLAQLIAERAQGWFANDRACQAWEPGGDEFLSSALCEAMLMRTVLPREAFRAWWDAFLPDAAQGKPATLFTPATVSDRSDGKIVHLDGLNLSRSWCWFAVADALGSDHPASTLARETGHAHLEASLPHLDDSYMGGHWLATFALLALEVAPRT